MEAIHILSNNIKEIEKMQTSKYVQSNLKNVFSEIKEKIDNNRKVLFTGTACQIAGLKKVIKDTELLYTCEIVCHGVPSPKVWKNYVKYIEYKYKSKLSNVNFRYKGKYGWITPFTKYYFEDGKEIQFLSYCNDIYMQGFSQSLYYRNTCYNCSYKGKRSMADITIGDFWGCPTELLMESENKGISVILINSQKGIKLIDKIAEKYIINETNLNNVIRENHPLMNSVKINKNREKFFNNLSDNDKEMIKNIKKLNLDKKIYIKKLLYKLRIFEKIKMIKYKKEH